SPAVPSMPPCSPTFPPRSIPVASVASSTPSPAPAPSSRVPSPYFPPRPYRATISSMPSFSPLPHPPSPMPDLTADHTADHTTRAPHSWQSHRHGWGLRIPHPFRLLRLM